MDSHSILLAVLLLFYVGLPLLCVASFAYKMTRVIDLWQPHDGGWPTVGAPAKVRVPASGQAMERNEERLREWHTSTD